MNKADVIRDYVARYQGMGTTELARLIEKENAGLVVKSQEVSKYRAREAAANLGVPVDPEPEDKQPEPTAKPLQAGLADRVAALKAAAEAVGGVTEAKRILDLLG